MSDAEAEIMPHTGTPTSWRDVYTLIQDVEERLTKRMDAASVERRAVGTDVEVRLRVLEKAQFMNQQSDSTSKNAVSAFRGVAVVGIAVFSALLSVFALLVRGV